MSCDIHLKKAELAAEAISALPPAPMNPGDGQAMVSAAPAEFVVPAHVHPLVVSFTAWMAGTAAGGLEMIKDAALAPDLGLHPQLTAICKVLPRVTLKTNLDSMLRNDYTGVDVESHPLIGGDKRRLHVLQRELQRACLTVTLLNVPVARRATFILIEVFRFTEGGRRQDPGQHSRRHACRRIYNP